MVAMPSVVHCAALLVGGRWEEGPGGRWEGVTVVLEETTITTA